MYHFYWFLFVVYVYPAYTCYLILVNYHFDELLDWITYICVFLGGVVCIYIHQGYWSNSSSFLYLFLVLELMLCWLYGWILGGFPPFQMFWIVLELEFVLLESLVNLAVKLFGCGLFFFERIFITESVPVLVITLFLFSQFS